MHVAIGILLIGHAFAHLVGFVGPWKIMRVEEMPYKTTLLGGKVDVGDKGIRVVGVFWLLGALGFLASGIGAFRVLSWWWLLTLIVAGFSLVLSVLGWPESRFGVLINVLLLGFLIVGRSIDWLPGIEN